MIMKLNDEAVTITNVFENLGSGSLNATNSFVVTNESEFPDYSGLNGISFTSCIITNEDGVRIPTQGLYKKVDAITVTYDEASRLYTANIILV